MKAACPICGDSSSIRLEHRKRVPLLQNRVWPDPISARSAPAGELDMRACVSCAFAWNAAFDPSRNLYDPAYDNDQMQSERFRSHTTAMMEKILQSLPSDRSVHLVEVGCGQGGFLDRLAILGQDRFASATGFDPSWRGENSIGSSGVEIHCCYFGPGVVDRMRGKAEAVVTRHTIEHVPDPLEFLRAIRLSMSESPASRLFIETPDIAWILKNVQLQDLFYEHCSLFSPRSLEIALALTGFEAIRIEPAFGEQYLWVEARLNESANDWSSSGFRSKKPGSFQDDAARYSERCPTTLAAWRGVVDARAQGEDIWLWGASSKGVTFALLVDPNAERLKGAIDINPNKVGRFMPVTGLPIAAPQSLRGGETVIVMNPNYRLEIERLIREMGKTGRVLTLETSEG